MYKNKQNTNIRRCFTPGISIPVKSVKYSEGASKHPQSPDIRNLLDEFREVVENPSREVILV